MMRYGEMGGAVSLGAPRKAPRRPLAKALSLSGLSGYLSAQGDVVGSLVDQTPGCSWAACAILHTMQQSVNPLQAAIAGCCDRNSDPSLANGKPPVFRLGRSSSTQPNVSLLQSCCAGHALRYH